MERLIEHDATTPPKHFYELRASRMANPGDLQREIVQLAGDADASFPRHKPAYPEPLFKWARHIAYVFQFIEARAHLGLDDLRPEEWRGVALWRAALANVRSWYRFCPQCSTALQARRKQCPWCHWTEPKG
jgi:hypothetical protein